MIQRTYERCCMAVEPGIVYVATDSGEIYEHCKSLGMQVVMTSENCLTGTDRIAEVANKLDADYYINVQGDEPLINPDDIKGVIEHTATSDGGIINGYAAIEEVAEFRSLTIPKVVFRNDGRLLYMSRSPVPGNKCDEFNIAYKQICIYAYPKQALQAFANEGIKTKLESIEDIEILRFLEIGYEVKMVKLKGDSIAVDTSEDVDKVVKRLKARGK